MSSLPGTPSQMDVTEVPPSSPPVDGDKSVVSRDDGGDNEDDDDDLTPPPAGSPGTEADVADKEKPAPRSKGKGAQSKDKNAGREQQIGKIRHLKKEDGEPLWRFDIQYDFLKAIFDDDKAVFTNSYDPEGIGKQTFADLYIDTMSRSTKTSKVLRDKLLSDKEAAKGMAMVCLLVNVGRMNTTLNFFPEMRAQLRTYHAIPSLQANQDPHAYKQLQDAPRLKSILKGGVEDRSDPNTLADIKEMDVPRSNPVNLIFVMCNEAVKIAELHFPPKREFHDLIMKTKYTSASRARAFLWLMWFHLESDFTEEGCWENPYGPGVDYGLGVANQGIPKLVKITDDMPPENEDTPEEIEFGREKQKTRAKILEMDLAYLNERENRRGKLRAPFGEDGPAILPRIRPSKNESDMDSIRSTPPPKGAGGRGQGSSRRGVPLKYQLYEGSSPVRPGPDGVATRKPRPPTAHQLAVERNRHERVEYILDRGIRRQHHRSRKLRKQDGAIFRAYKRVTAQEDPLEDSDDEASYPRNLPAGTDKTFREKGIGGLCLLASEKDDYGEEASTYTAALRRATRRLLRWSEMEGDVGVIAPVKRPKKTTNGEANGGDAEANGTPDLTAPVIKVNGEDEANGDVTMEDVDLEDQTAMMGDDERGADDDMDDPDRTEVMSDVEVA